MQTNFTAGQLADPHLAEANTILRKCVHCGFCTATCPTYVLLGDELDSPRGRIYLAKEMLEHGKPATANIVKHFDRCLTCRSCMTTCPSGVDYARLIGHARAHVAKTYSRPRSERYLRRLLAYIVPRPRLFRLASIAGAVARPLTGLMPGQLKRIAAMAPETLAARSRVDAPQVFPSEGARRLRVALLNGCAQTVLRPAINEATVRALNRHGCEVVVAKGAGCCGGIMRDMSMEAGAKRFARANIVAWSKLVDDGGLDAVVFNASGCGIMLKEYGDLFADEPAVAADAKRIAAVSKDICEILLELGLHKPAIETGQRVTYHLACSMQHGLGLRTPPKQLLREAGFQVSEPAESHICCGSAGIYSILQPDLSERLRQRKLDHIAATRPEIVATGNIACITHLQMGSEQPVVHTVELLDWATGGPKPAMLTQPAVNAA